MIASQGRCYVDLELAGRPAPGRGAAGRRECKKKVEDCEHFVYPITAKRVSVFDPKIEFLAYSNQQRILEIAFKGGQVWQLFNVPPGIYREPCDSTISSFLKFIARRYQFAPVKTGLKAIRVPEAETCSTCQGQMTQAHRNGSTIDNFLRVRWTCSKCNTSVWKPTGQARSETEKRDGIEDRCGGT